MIIVGVSAIAIAIGLGRVLGGRVRNLEAIRISELPAAIAAFGLMVLALLVPLPGWGRGLVLVTGYGCAFAVLVVNLRSTGGAVRAGIGAILGGWTLNVAVMSLNGGMPLSMRAYGASGQTAAPTPGEGGFFKIVLADDSTLLRHLGDVIPVPGVGQVVSIGDVFLYMGFILTVVAAMRARPAASPRAA